jgi:hypothetical protein
LCIEATHKDRPDEKFLIECDKAQTKQIQSEFGDDYHSMAEHLRVMNLRMVLMGKMSKEELDDVKSHDISEGYLGSAVIRAQSKRLDDGLGMKDLNKTNKCFGVFGMDLNDGKGTKYEAEIFEFDMDCDKSKGK